MSLMYTSLSVDYQRDSWGRAQAVREIISNALDGEERGRVNGTGALTVDYNARARRLTVSNQGVTVPASALLLGVSQSRDHAGCIGTFGEGLPMALLVLARLMCKVVITNGAERWEPKIVVSPEYGNRVLAVQTRKLPQDHGCFRVVFEDIEESDWAEWRTMFLRFDDRLKPDTVVDALTSEGQLLIDPIYKGRVYVKGVYTHSRTDLLFGYNINIPVGRDRQYVNSHELQEAVHATVTGALQVAEGEARSTICDQLVWSVEGMETESPWGALAQSEHFVLMVRDAIQRRFGTTPVVLSSYDCEVKEVEENGGRAVVLSNAARSALRDRSITYGEWTRRKARAVTKVCGYQDLSDEEREVLRFAVGRLAPVRKEKGKLRVVEFATRAYEYDVQDGVLLLGRVALKSKTQALWALARLSSCVADQQHADPMIAGMLLAQACAEVK